MILIYYLAAFFVLVFAALAVYTKDLLYATIFLSGSALMLMLVFFLLQAPDIAITQAAVNAGLVTAILILTISKTERLE